MRLDHREIDERIEARSEEFQSGLISAIILRASFYALGKRGHELDLMVRMQERIKH